MNERITQENTAEAPVSEVVAGYQAGVEITLLSAETPKKPAVIERLRRIGELRRMVAELRNGGRNRRS